MWFNVADSVSNDYGAYVNWEEEFYICPECGEPVYKEDWEDNDFEGCLCPICGFSEE